MLMVTDLSQYVQIRSDFLNIVNLTYSFFLFLRKETLVLIPSYWTTEKPVLRGHLKIDKTKVLMEKGSLMQVEGIASQNAILQYF